jgi:8-oxo-dGTP pyrophosphatase MutT (NUDIX family)
MTTDKSMRFASTMLLLRDGADGLEVFMVVRHHQIDFASGALVFPGGSIDPDDHAIAANAALYTNSGDFDAMATAMRVGAARETFEECGILLARPRGSQSLVAGSKVEAIVDKHRAALCEGKTTFSDILTANDLVLALDLLVPFAHWITPVGLPKRFDTQFYLAIAPSDQLGAHDGLESVDSIWVSPNAAVDGARTGKFTLVFATERNLIKLGRATSAFEAIKAAQADRIVSVLPEITKTETGRQLRIPAEAGYDGDVFDMPPR